MFGWLDNYKKRLCKLSYAFDLTEKRFPNTKQNIRPTNLSLIQSTEQNKYGMFTLRNKKMLFWSVKLRDYLTSPRRTVRPYVNVRVCTRIRSNLHYYTTAWDALLHVGVMYLDSSNLHCIFILFFL